MSLAFMLFLQAGAMPAAPPLAIDFDLARYRPGDDGTMTGARACGRGDDESTVIVCGVRRGGGAYPLAEWARIFATRPLVAETGIVGDLRGDVHAEAAVLDRGTISNRLMVRFRLPF